jgi:hypothetical protein
MGERKALSIALQHIFPPEGMETDEADVLQQAGGARGPLQEVGQR